MAAILIAVGKDCSKDYLSKSKHLFQVGMLQALLNCQKQDKKAQSQAIITVKVPTVIAHSKA